MPKVIIADNVGGYWLTELAYEYLGLDWNELVVYPIERAAPGFTNENTPKGFYGWERNMRTDPKLVKMVESLGEHAGNHLVVVNVKDGREWDIEADEVGWEKIIYLDEKV